MPWWSARTACLRGWAETNGHLLAPLDATHLGYRVGIWLKNARAAARKGRDRAAACRGPAGGVVGSQRLRDSPQATSRPGRPCAARAASGRPRNAGTGNG
ncbi:helicase associated domain-containing protein [Streptomyces sp. NPDC059999]|uniref:helicase associated domain-containing protein n=1 Tax=Streptomyces sp. NPDC059999 TaxID=3347030 RepID=UPI003677276D